jgi:hypothetical protein
MVAFANSWRTIRPIHPRTKPAFVSGASAKSRNMEKGADSVGPLAQSYSSPSAPALQPRREPRRRRVRMVISLHPRFDPSSRRRRMRHGDSGRLNYRLASEALAPLISFASGLPPPVFCFFLSFGSETHYSEVG